MVEFTGNEDLDFVVGQMNGIRSFKVNHQGWLKACTNGFIYQPGENKAGCTQFDTGPDGEISRNFPRGFMDRTGKIRDLITHRVAKDWCSCGFYGYYHRFYNSYGERSTITAIVAGYGRISYSNRGFRSAKLKLVAAVNPYLTETDKETGPAIPEALIKKLKRADKWSMDDQWFKVRIGLALGLFLNMFLTILCIFFIGGATADFYQWWGWLGNGLFFGGTLSTVVIQARTIDRRKVLEIELEQIQQAYETRLSKLYEFEVNNGHRVSAGLTSDQFQMVAKRYPEIKWYKTVSEMLAAHSLTQYEETPGYERNRTKKKRSDHDYDGWY